MPGATRLSAQGVELALREHLETSPAAEHLAAMARSAGQAARCHLVLAANVCTAALRAIAWALCTAPQVLVRPSRRDPVVAELLCRGLQELQAKDSAVGNIALVTELDAKPGDEVHLYGSDASLASIRARLPATVRVRAHGTGLGLAVVANGAPLEQAAVAVAADVAPFDQRGCLSPRVALVQGGPARAEQFARALHEALSELGLRVPRGPLDDREQSDLARFRATAEPLGPFLLGPEHAVALDQAPRALLLPPALRCVLVAPCEPTEVPALVGPWSRYVAALGGVGPHGDRGELGRALTAACPGARCSALGRMQKPPLDGPADLRPTSQWAAEPALGR